MSTLRFSKRMEDITFSKSQATIRRVRELRRQGVEVIDFGTRADTPKDVKAAAMRQLETTVASLYTDARGLAELRLAIAKKLAAENGIAADPETEIIASIGGKQGIQAALLALVDSGDEVLIEDPGWLSFEPMVRIAGATPVPIALIEDNGFNFTIDDLHDKITPRTRLIILCNPHNPTGRVLDRAALEAIARVAREHDIYVLMDEAYERFMYDGRGHVSMAALDGMWSRTITVQTTSKIYNMFGWRVGWIAARAELIEKFLTINSHSITCPTSFAQAGAAAALGADIGQGDLPIATIVQNYERQRNALVAGLRAIPGITCEMPSGAYFVFPNIRRFGLSSREISLHLLENAGVATLPGSDFGNQGEGHLRLVFNAPVAEIERGLEKMATALRGI